MIKLLTFNAKEKDFKTLEKIRDFLEVDAEIIDLFSFIPDFENGDILLVFGNKTYRQINSMSGYEIVVLPDIGKLDSELGNTDDRRYVFKVLKEIKEKKIIKEDNNTSNETRKIEVDSLKEFSIADALDHFKKNIEQQGDYHWIAQLKNGEQMKVANQVDTNFKGISITFDELIQLKVAIDTLDIQGVEIVGKPNS